MAADTKKRPADGMYAVHGGVTGAIAAVAASVVSSSFDTLADLRSAGCSGHGGHLSTVRRVLMTVGELRDHLERFPADLEVVMQTQVVEWRAVARVDEPCGDADRAQQGVCLIPGEGLAQPWR